MRVSPIALRKGLVPRRRIACRPAPDAVFEDPDTDHGNSDAPSQPSRKPAVRAVKSQGNSGQVSKRAQSSRSNRRKQQASQFCTRRCLLGLVRGGNLDHNCPNVKEHGTNIQSNWPGHRAETGKGHRAVKQPVLSCYSLGISWMAWPQYLPAMSWSGEYAKNGPPVYLAPHVDRGQGCRV